MDRERKRERTAHTLNIKLYTHYLGSIRHKLKLGLSVTCVFIVLLKYDID